MSKKQLLLVLLLLILANVALFWKFYFKGLLPFPGDLLVSYYFPWSSGGFAGFDSWTTHKGVVAMDVIRVMYPWKSLVVDQLSKWQWPLWNPYNFSGTPLLANLQSSVFYPTTLVLLVLPFLSGWISLVLFLPLLFSVFNFLFLRSLKLSLIPSIFGAVVISNLSYLAVWGEQLNILQAVLFLPLILWAINYSRLLFLPFLIALTLIGGHPQTAVYVLIISFTYGLFKRVSPLKLVALFSLGAIIGAVQLFPTLELYLQSARESKGLHEAILQTAFPWKHLATIFAPDFFGNPATGNFSGLNYDNSLGYFGIVAAVLSVVAICKNFAKSEIKFFFFLGLFGLIFALPPFAYLFVNLKIPILSSGFASRTIFLFQFGMGVLSAFGLQKILEDKNIDLKKIFFFFSTIFVTLFIVALTFNPVLRRVSLHNLILPTVVFACTCTLLSGRKFLLRFFGILLVILAIFEYGYFFNKYQPFATSKFVFPNHPVVTYLQNHGGIDRFFGVDRAYIDSNFSTYYRVFGVEGYDPLFIKRYGEFLASSDISHLPDDIPPSDAWVGKIQGKDRERALDILGVKYIVDKTDEPQKDWEPDLARFPKDKYDLVWRVNKWKIFSRTSALPRAFLAGNYVVETTDEKTFNRLYDKDFNPRQTIILEKKPGIVPTGTSSGWVKVESYIPNKIIFKTESETENLLFLSDNYYPGWKAQVDGKPTEILRANYTFRAVVVPAGEHTIQFLYDPDSFRWGLVVSLIGTVTVGGLFILKRYRK